MEENETKKAAPSANKRKDVLIDFGIFKRAKKEPDRDGVIKVAPEELGLDREEVGLGPMDRVAMHYGPLGDGEDGEIRELIKDYEGTEWGDEYRWEVIRRGMIQPAIPNNQEGRDAVARWLPGTRGQIAQAILNQTGMGLHEIKDAREELGNLVALNSAEAQRRGKSTA